MEKLDLSMFSTEDLISFRENALRTYKLIKKQQGGIPSSEVPTKKLVEMDELERKIELYERELLNRSSLSSFVSEQEIENIRKELKHLIAENQTEKALSYLINNLKLDEDLHNQIILLSARFRKAKLKDLNSLENQNHLEIEFSKINNALLEILKSI